MLPIRLKPALLCLALTAHCAWANTPWGDGQYTYYADHVPVARVLADFATAFGVHFQATDACASKIRKTVSGQLNARSPAAFLERLGSSYGIALHYSEGVIHCEAMYETAIESVHVSAGSMGHLRQALKSMGIVNDRYGWGELPEQNLVLVSGPRQYVSRVKEVIQNLRLSPIAQHISVFRLQHANVVDREYQLRDRTVVTPGLASILKKVIAGESSLGSHAEVREAVEELNRAGTPIKTGQPGGANISRRINASIEPDQRLNAIIIRDTPEAMPVYERLIKLLDTPTRLVEIDALIIEVSSDKLKELGFDWTVRSGRTTFGFGDPASVPTTGTISLGKWNTAASASLILDSATDFLGRLRLLESAGDARILSRPSILTSENQAALLDLSETFYARVVGERTASLQPVSTGVMLRVTPRAQSDTEGRQRISLAVDIEDGNFKPGVSIDGLPITRKSTISTHAVVHNGASLLIGGHTSENDIFSNNKVPLLGDIPLFGGLFSQEKMDRRRRERIFMISPRVVSLDARSAEDMARATQLLAPKEAKPVSAPEEERKIFSP